MLGFVAVSFSSFSETSSKNMQQGGLKVINNDEDHDKEKRLIEADEKDAEVAIYKTNNYVWFHLMMAAFSIYLI